MFLRLYFRLNDFATIFIGFYFWLDTLVTTSFISGFYRVRGYNNFVFKLFIKVIRAT